MLEQRLEERMIVLKNQEDLEKVNAFMEKEHIEQLDMTAQRVYWGTEAEFQLAEVYGKQLKHINGEKLSQEEYEIAANRLADLFYEDSDYIIGGDSLSEFIEEKVKLLTELFSGIYQLDKSEIV